MYGTSSLACVYVVSARFGRWLLLHLPYSTRRALGRLKVAPSAVNRENVPVLRFNVVRRLVMFGEREVESWWWRWEMNWILKIILILKTTIFTCIFGISIICSNKWSCPFGCIVSFTFSGSHWLGNRWFFILLKINKITKTVPHASLLMLNAKMLGPWSDLRPTVM